MVLCLNNDMPTLQTRTELANIIYFKPNFTLQGLWGTGSSPFPKREAISMPCSTLITLDGCWNFETIQFLMPDNVTFFFRVTKLNPMKEPGAKKLNQRQLLHKTKSTGGTQAKKSYRRCVC